MANAAGDLASAGAKLTDAFPPNLKSCRYILGGAEEAESRMFPSDDIARMLGGDGWSCSGGRGSPVEMQYACIDVLSVVAK